MGINSISIFRWIGYKNQFVQWAAAVYICGIRETAVLGQYIITGTVKRGFSI